MAGSGDVGVLLTACTRGFAVPQNCFWSPATLFYVDDNKPFGTDTEIFECT